MKRALPGGLALLLFVGLLLAGWMAPEFLSAGDPELAYQSIREAPPLGTDASGRPLTEYALQGAGVVAGPSLLAAVLVGALAIVGGVLASMGMPRVQALVQGSGEIVGALPRLVVVLVVALLLPKDQRSLAPIAITWALLSAPGAIDEASAVAQRLGGARFVEALRAHGFSRARIYLWHIVGLNLRPVVVRQGADTFVQVVFLEIGLSYLVSRGEPALTHGDSVHSWASILHLGYGAFLDVPATHALWVGFGLITIVAAFGVLVNVAARAR